MAGKTVKELRDLCEAEIAKGNGNKRVLLSMDDEGNGYHALYVGFDSEDLASIQDLFHDGDDPDEVILLY